jgi:hypothetical protein
VMMLRRFLVVDTGNASRNIPNTMCGLVGTFLISAKMFLIPCVLWAISGTISNMFLIPNYVNDILKLFVKNYSEAFYAVHVYVPEGEELDQVVADYYAKMGFPGCVGSMDVTHLMWKKQYPSAACL